MIDMHDYTAAARRYWWVVSVSGAAALAFSIHELLQLSPAAISVSLAGAALAAIVGMFVIILPGVRAGIAGAEIIVFFLLILYGTPAAVLAGASEGFIGATRKSKRWTSRIFTPAMTSLTILLLGSAFERARELLSNFMPAIVALLVSVIAFAGLYFFASAAFSAALLALKRGERVAMVLWAAGNRLLYMWYFTSALIAALLYVSLERFGISVMFMSLPIIAMFITTAHLLARLELANRHKREFLANMSHELRTPLNCIIGGSDLLREGVVGKLNAGQAQWVGDIRESGIHLLTLINDILDLSKIEAGRMELDLRPVDLPSAIGDALTLVKERARRHGIRLGSDLAPDLGSVVADALKLRQILVNLLSNAVKFTPDGGEVTVSARRVDGGVEIAVADTGVGIAKGDQEAIFEAFRQGGNNFRKAEGTGLGLALARDLAQLHGGALRLESEPGKGSTFTVFLPDAAQG